jgi:hypothetical protein
MVVGEHLWATHMHMVSYPLDFMLLCVRVCVRVCVCVHVQYPQFNQQKHTHFPQSQTLVYGCLAHAYLQQTLMHAHAHVHTYSHTPLPTPPHPPTHTHTHTYLPPKTRTHNHAHTHMHTGNGDAGAVSVLEDGGARAGPPKPAVRCVACAPM